MPKYLLCLCGTMDELPVRLFDTEEELRAFAAANPPAPVDGGCAVTSGPLAAAARVRGCGPSAVLGYVAFRFVNDVPERSTTLYWGDTDGDGAFKPDAAFDPTVAIFPVEPDYCEEWDLTGGGPVS